MKSQVQAITTAASRSQLRAFSAMGLAAAVLIAWPGRSHAHDQHAPSYGGGGHAMHAQAFRPAGHDNHSQVWRGPSHYPVAHAVHADWHGGVGFHAAGPGYRGGYGVGWHDGGAWNHGWHGGHYGWWYINAGVWTLYPYYPYGYYPYGYPYYAYPAPYGYVPPESPAVNSNLPPPPQSWYYCDASRAYYPYVQTCPGGWRPVAAQPAPTATQAPPPARAPEPVTAPPQ